MATLIPCLVRLRDEFNQIAPARDKASDGWIGDSAHSSRSSDHNPDSRGLVHAIDVDTDLRESDLTMQKCVDKVLSHCRRSSSDPLNEARLTYIIWDRHIYEAPGWSKQPYTGSSDPHTNHAHFSAEHVPSLERDTSTWHLEEIPVALTAADKTWYTQLVDDKVDAAADRIVAAIEKRVGDIVAYPNPDPANPTVAPGTALGWLLSNVADIKAAVVKPTAKP